jgi:hypothetical protein
MRPRKTLACILAAALTFGLPPGPAGAATQDRGTPATNRAFAWWIPVWEIQKPGANRAGLYIAIDPVTHGPVAPAPDQILGWNTRRALDALRAPTRPLAVQTLRAGGEIVHLNGGFRSFAIARVGPDGKVVTKCVP